MRARVTVVEERTFGSALASSSAIGATQLLVEDVVDFDGDGGTLEVGVETLRYSGIDEDTNAVLMLDLPASTHAAEDFVALSPLTVERVAHVQQAEDQDGDEDMEARVPHALYEKLPTGIRDSSTAEGETVVVEFDGDELVVVDVTGQEPLIDASYLDTDTIPPPVTTDGFAPASSPTPTIQGGVGFLLARWDPIANADLVTYEVYVDDSSGFTPGVGSYIGEGNSNFFFIKKMPDGSDLAYGTTYYVKLIAKDDDGSAAAGAQGSGQMVQVTSPDIAVNAVTAGSILAGAVTADKLEAFLILANTIATASTGARVEFDALGIRLYDTSDAITMNLDADSGNITIRGQFDFGADPANLSRLSNQDLIELVSQPTSVLTPALVQSTHDDTLTSTLSATWPAQTTLGNLLLMQVVVFASTGTPQTITTPAGWTLISSTLSGCIRMATFKRENSARRTSESVTLSGAPYTATIKLAEFSGAQVEDVKVATAATSTATWDSGTTAATTQAAELIFGAVARGSGVASGNSVPDIVAPSGYSRVSNVTYDFGGSGNFSTALVHKNVVATGTQQITKTESQVASNNIAHLVTFKAKTATGGPGAGDTGRSRLYAKTTSGAARLHVTNDAGLESAVAVGKADQVWRFEIYSPTINFASTGAHAGGSTSFTATGCAIGDVVCYLGSDVASANSWLIRPEMVSVTDQITLHYFNADSVTVDPASAVYHFLVIHRS